MSSPNSTGQIRANLREILSILQQQIIAATGLDPNAVWITRRKDHLVAVAEQSVALWVRGESPYGRAAEGGGRVDDIRVRTVTLLCRTRTLQDEADRDTSRITDFSLGAIQLEDQVCDAVQLIIVTNAQLQAIVAFPPSCGQ